MSEREGEIGRAREWQGLCHSNALVCAINWHILANPHIQTHKHTYPERDPGRYTHRHNEFCVCRCCCIMHRMRIRMKILLHLMATRKKAAKGAASSPLNIFFFFFFGNIILCKNSYFTVETHKICRRSFVDSMSWWPTNGQRPAN